MVKELWSLSFDAKHKKTVWKILNPNDQIRNIIEFLEGFKHFYQKEHIKIELRVQEFLETELWCTF